MIENCYNGAKYISYSLASLEQNVFFLFSQ